MKKFFLITFIILAFRLGAAAAQPSAVTDLSATSSAEGQVVLQWTVPDPGIGSTPSGYLVKYAITSIASGDFDTATTYPQSWTTFVSSGSVESRTLSGFAPSTTLNFAIKAYNSSSEYGPWNGPSPSAAIFDAVPDAVTGVTAARGNGLVNLSWTANAATDIKYYIVERSSYSSTDGFTFITNITPGTTHQDSGVANGNLYYYRIKAEDNMEHVGAYSAVVSTMPWVALGTPSVSAATVALSTTSIAWVWSFASNAAGYRVINSSSGVNLSGDLAGTTNYFLQQGLSPNTSSTMYVQAFNGVITANSLLRTAYTFANPPAAVTSSETTSRVDLSWSANDNSPVTRYSVQRSTDSFVHFVNAMVLAPSTTHQDTGLGEGTTYQYRIWAVNDESTATVKVEYSTTTASIPPNTPVLGNVQSGTSDGEVTIDWVASGDDGTSGLCSAYVVKWATYAVTENNFDGIVVSSVIAGTKLFPLSEPTHTIGGLFPGTTYWFAIRAVDDGGNYSLISDTKTAVARDNPPQTPTGLNVTALSPTTINVSWTYPAYSGYDDRDVYKIYRATFSFSSYGTNVTTITKTHPSGAFVDSGLNPKTTYYYRISTLDKGDQGNGLFSHVLESPLSSVVSAYTPDRTPPAAITQLAAAPGVTEGKIDLSWVATGDDGTDGAISGGKFRIDWDLDPMKNFTTNSYRLDIATTTTPGTTGCITVSGLGEGVTYYFRIWTADPAGNWSALSGGATAWSQIDVSSPAAAGDLSAAPAWRRVTLSWTAPGDDGSSNTLNGAYDVRLSSTGPIDDMTKWNAVPAGYPYRISISTLVAPGTPENLVVTGLANGTTYYFALRSVDERGNWSGLSTVSPSTAPFNRAPGVFALSSPVDNSISTTLQPVLGWSVSADPDAVYGDEVTYTVAYSTDSSFPGSATTISPGIAGTTFNADLNFFVHEDKTVYWKILAVDADGLTMASPGYYRMRINSQNSAPASFALIAPAVGVTTTTATPQLFWNASQDVDPGDAITYRVDYSRDNFSTFTSSSGIVTTGYITPALVENATYWWRVWAMDGTVMTCSAATFYFSVNAVPEPPLAFSLSMPTDNLILSTTTVTFSWQATADPDPGDSVTYDLSWSDSQDFVSSTTITGLTQATTSHRGFNENGIYYWRVNAVGSDGQRRQSNQSWRFYVDSKKDLPGTFELLEPGYNVTISTTVTPLFSWTKAIDPDPADDVRYIFDISLSPDFPEDLRTQAVDRGSDRYYVPLIGLTDQTTYYWRVRSSGYQGNPIPVQVDPGFAFSSTGVFVISMVNNPPEAFTLESPANGNGITTKKPTFKWGVSLDRDVSASVSYTILISSCADFSVIIESTTGLSSPSYPIAATLLENRTYYWKVWATDNKNAVTNAASIFSFTVPILNVPRAPAGLTGQLADDKMSFAIIWSPVVKNSNNAAIDDLAGYHVYRGLSPRTLSLYAVVSSTADGWTDHNTQGGNLYYRVRAFDTSGIESAAEDSPLLNSLSADSLNMMSDDQSFLVDIPPAVALALRAQNNTYNDDLSVKFDRNSSVENDTILVSYRINIIKSDGSAIDKFLFDQPLVLTFNYGTGSPAGARLAAQKAVVLDSGSLNVFWHNGIEYMRLGGAMDTREHNVTLRVLKPGEYQLRRVARPTTFRVASIDPPKLFTPGIAPYAKITFYVDNPDGDKVTGQVFDLRSEFVADLRANGDPTASNVILEWDGQTSDSGPAPKGVYIYQIEGSGKIINGTIMIAR